MRVIFIGTVVFSLKALQKLIEINAEVVGVCTKQGTDFNSDYADLSKTCADNNIPCLIVDNINSKASYDWIKGLEPDIIFCFGWSSLIKKELLMLPSMGVVGYHPAALPKNRGRHPLIWALVLGLEESASTFFFMSEGADDGDILAQENFEIKYIDDAETLYARVIHIALKQIEDFVPKLECNIYKRVKQNHSYANTWRKRGKSDGRIDFRMNSTAVYNLVRGLTRPYVGAHIVYSGSDVIVWKAEEVACTKRNIEPGIVLESKAEGIFIKCQENAIRILDHEFKELPFVGEYL